MARREQQTEGVSEGRIHVNIVFENKAALKKFLKQMYTYLLNILLKDKYWKNITKCVHESGYFLFEKYVCIISLNFHYFFFFFFW